jgi:hypothetical protein
MLPSISENVEVPHKKNGITAEETVEATELPTELVATTVKVYAVPFVNPVTIMGEVVPDTEMLPGLDVTV